jgi:hypothetical protein
MHDVGNTFFADPQPFSDPTLQALLILYDIDHRHCAALGEF